MQAYTDFVVNLSDGILKWAKPAHFPAGPGPMAGWPLASGFSAFSIAFGYLAFVLVFSIIMKVAPKIKAIWTQVSVQYGASHAVLVHEH